ncbi:MAG: hypothetical protein K2U26_06520 [Cyclobacteriaceae bacterium]|nr:hypothetical protein [Cyclobacteriaceae bacterium]
MKQLNAFVSILSALVFLLCVCGISFAQSKNSWTTTVGFRIPEGIQIAIGRDLTKLNSLEVGVGTWFARSSITISLDHKLKLGGISKIDRDITPWYTGQRFTIFHADNGYKIFNDQYLTLCLGRLLPFDSKAGFVFDLGPTFRLNKQPGEDTDTGKVLPAITLKFYLKL